MEESKTQMDNNWELLVVNKDFESSDLENTKSSKKDKYK